MFLPLDRKPDWRNPPTITLLLIVVNFLCFALWQHNDERYEADAYQYYLNSSLPDIELPLYRQFLSDSKEVLPLSAAAADDPGNELVFSMLFDSKFQQALEQGRIINASHPDYNTWLQQHDEFKLRLSKIVIYNYSLKTAQPDIITLFSHMFLHGDWVHLISNLVFLFLVGFSVEITLGKKVYLGAYLTAGLCSGLFYIMLDPDSLRWGVGASGAIAGLIGMYTVLFGRRKIRFFYTLLFYFDYVKAPAILLLPAWLAYELYNQFFMPSNINNLAHIGGLLSGAVIGFVAKKYMHINFSYLDEEDKQEKFKTLYQQGMEYMAKMDTPRARQAFKELEQDYPDKLEVVEQLFNLAKFKPESEDIHFYANKLFNMQLTEKLSTKYIHDIFIDYAELVQPNVRINPEQLMTLALRFAAGGFIEDAEKIVLYLTTRKNEFARNAEGLMALATHYKRNQNQSKAEKYLKILLECYPNSNEAHIARQTLA